jgi:hypothetical protein
MKKIIDSEEMKEYAKVYSNGIKEYLKRFMPSKKKNNHVDQSKTYEVYSKEFAEGITNQLQTLPSTENLQELINKAVNEQVVKMAVSHIEKNCLTKVELRNYIKAQVDNNYFVTKDQFHKAIKKLTNQLSFYVNNGRKSMVKKNLINPN